MTPAHEQLYGRTLHGLVAAGVEFCVGGSFALRCWRPALPAGQVPDCDLQLPPDPAVLTALVRHLRAAGWQVTLWNQPVRLPLTARCLAGKYYLRARQAGAVLDCAYENDYWPWLAFAAARRWHAGLPLLAAEAVLRQKQLTARPHDLALLAWWAGGPAAAPAGGV